HARRGRYRLLHQGPSASPATRAVESRWAGFQSLLRPCRLIDLGQPSWRVQPSLLEAPESGYAKPASLPWRRGLAIGPWRSPERMSARPCLSVNTLITCLL